MGKRAWATIAGIVLGGLGSAERAGAERMLYVSPTVGAWHWDHSGYPDFEVDAYGPVFGVRGGYAITQAFAAELVALTGTTGTQVAGVSSESLRQSQIELSLVVNFQSLAIDRVYPFLDLGAGVAIRRGGPETSSATSVEDEQLAFHLGGGVALELDRRWALRLNVRDTFFTDDRLVGNVGDQLTVDTVELSLGVVIRFPVGNSGPRSLQSLGFDAGVKPE
jgi:hypothetical protein